MFVWLISHQPAVLFSQNKPATNNQPTTLLSQNKSELATSHKPNEQAAYVTKLYIFTKIADYYMHYSSDGMVLVAVGSGLDYIWPYAHKLTSHYLHNLTYRNAHHTSDQMRRRT
jgi:hypothetical protein